MTHKAHQSLVSFIWSIADDHLRDVYVRGKYRDIILPMVVLRRLDALLEDTKEAVKAERDFQEKEDIEDIKAFEEASGYVFYNKGEYTLKGIHKKSNNSRQTQNDLMNDYFKGFSDNVKEIIDKFKLRTKVKEMIDKNIWLGVLDKFVSPKINLTNKEKENSKGEILPPLSNLGMGYVFEELVRKFNEENNEEAGEHFTPREVIKLMTHLVFLPLKDNFPKVFDIYDPACGSGGMLTESQNFVLDPNGEINAPNTLLKLYGVEVNDETYAICKSDMMIKANDPSNIKLGSTITENQFNKKFYFMLTNPPYGKSWKSEKAMIEKEQDARFMLPLADYWGEVTTTLCVPPAGDGQLLFMMDMVSKMKDPNQSNGYGSRIASVHNGSSLFTGDAGSGASNIRRYIIEQDLLQAVIQLPNNLFYNTGITTYIWLLSNNKLESQKGKILLIDASEQFQKLRKNLGNKNCELSDDNIQRIQEAFFDFGDLAQEDLHAKCFDNKDFGYYKVPIRRPNRLATQCSDERIHRLGLNKKYPEIMLWMERAFADDVYTPEVANLKEQVKDWAHNNNYEPTADELKPLLNIKNWQERQRLQELARYLQTKIGAEEIFMDFNTLMDRVEEIFKESDYKVTKAKRTKLLKALSWYDAEAEKVIEKSKKYKEDEEWEALLQRLPYDADGNPVPYTTAQLADLNLHCIDEDKRHFVQYESASDLNDEEQISLYEGIYDYFLKEVKPYQDEAWIDYENVKIGYEISFNKYFYRPTPLRSLEEVSQEIMTLDKSSQNLLDQILNL